MTDHTPIDVTLQMSERDFQRLWITATAWAGKGHLQDQWEDGRWEFDDSRDPRTDKPSFEWKMAYFLGDNSTAVVLAKSYLAAKGEAYDVLWDMAECNDRGDVWGYCILTNYDPGDFYERYGKSGAEVKVHADIVEAVDNMLRDHDNGSAFDALVIDTAGRLDYTTTEVAEQASLTRRTIDGRDVAGSWTLVQYEVGEEIPALEREQAIDGLYQMWVEAQD